jgi:quercetin dioxygenase-like cupin family protein
MTVFEQTRPAPMPLPGLAHATWAGEAEGLTQLSLWRQTIDPGGATPPHAHYCDEVVLCLAGRGEVHLDGAVHAFAAGSTVVLPRGPVHQLVNVGKEPMEVLGIFGATPVMTRTPEGEPMALPWRS